MSLLFITFSERAYSQKLTLFEAENGKYGYKNSRNDKVVISPTFVLALEQEFLKLLFVCTDSGWVGINPEGKFLFRVYVVDNGPDKFSSGLVRCVMGGLIGYPNKQGKVVVPPAYRCAYPFAKRKAKVSLDSEIKREGEHRSFVAEKWINLKKRGSKVTIN